MQRRRLAAVFALGTLGIATLPACAHVPPPPPTVPAARLGALGQLSVIDRSTGRELPVYRHAGEYWVAGTPGTRYALRLHNRQGERLLAVMSVDGVNVISGETAGLGQTGYVFGPGERGDIAGWRKSDSQIAAFEFTALAEAYASRTGRPQNVGVIGVALFRERVPVPPAPPVARQEAAPASPASPAAPQRERRAAPGAGAAADKAAETGAAAPAAAEESRAIGRAATPRPAQSLGTGHGRRENSVIGRTQFERAQDTPDEVIRIRYDSRENLVAAGIIPRPRPAWPTVPQAFPESSAGFVPDPPARH